MIYIFEKYVKNENNFICRGAWCTTKTVDKFFSAFMEVLTDLETMEVQLMKNSRQPTIKSITAKGKQRINMKVILISDENR